MTRSDTPVVLVLAGHDPTGGAGIQADIEAIGQRGCHAACVITALTAQNTARVQRILPQEPGYFSEQLQLVTEDMEIAACKVGVCPGAPIIHAVADFLAQQPGLPVVFDPVLVASSGGAFLEDEALQALRRRLLPLATLITPNTQEAHRLSGQHDPADAAATLLKAGPGAVLITGADEGGDSVTNILYRRDETPMAFRYKRLPGTYHGSGCTLSSAIAAELARGRSLPIAVRDGLDYTRHCLENARQLGRAQLHPNRWFRAPR